MVRSTAFDIQGARAVLMDKQIGSLAEGKLADIVILDAESPGIISAAEQDPVSAIVMQASIRDTVPVIINGKVRKADGEFLPARIEKGISGLQKVAVEWKDRSHELLKNRKELQTKIEKLDCGKVGKAMIRIFHIDEKDLVDEI